MEKRVFISDPLCRFAKLNDFLRGEGNTAPKPPRLIDLLIDLLIYRSLISISRLFALCKIVEI